MLSGNQYVHNTVTELLEELLPDPGWSSFAAYIVVFLGVYVISRMIFQILERVFTKQAPGWLDRILGALAGLAKGLVACTIVLVCIAYIAPESNFRQASVMAPYFNDFWNGVSSLTGGAQQLPELSLPQL